MWKGDASFYPMTPRAIQISIVTGKRNIVKKANKEGKQHQCETDSNWSESFGK
jgi:hypothetical protein